MKKIQNALFVLLFSGFFILCASIIIKDIYLLAFSELIFFTSILGLIKIKK